MTDFTTVLTALWPEGEIPEAEALAHLQTAWRSGEAIPRLADKTVTPMAGARVDLESYQFSDEKSGN